MCGPALAPGHEQYVVDNATMREFIATVTAARRAEQSPAAIIKRIRPAFQRLLADPTWLPAEYQEPAVGSGMGGGIGMWLLYRAADASLAFSSLVVPAGVATPVHDHLAWGLVGLYRGEQAEDVFVRRDDGQTAGQADLLLSESRRVKPGDLYELLPETDIHRVRTVSAVTSVSLHLLGNDNGCIWRHRYLPDEGRVEPFRSGYINVPCAETA